MSRSFFEQVDDELRGLVGPKLRSYSSYKAGRLLKVWYGDGRIHFEAQIVGPRWSGTGDAAVEVGLHIELADAKSSQAAMERICKPKVLKSLGEPQTGRALGPRGASWRRVSELIPFTDEDDLDLASEVAERLAVYVKVLAPEMTQAPSSSA